MRKQTQPSNKQDGTYPNVTDLVLQDLRDRHEKGLRDYGVPLQPFNSRSALLDLYEELLDSVLYLRQLLYEQDHNQHEE